MRYMTLCGKVVQSYKCTSNHIVSFQISRIGPYIAIALFSEFTDRFKILKISILDCSIFEPARNPLLSIAESAGRFFDTFMFHTGGNSIHPGSEVVRKTRFSLCGFIPCLKIFRVFLQLPLFIIFVF